MKLSYILVVILGLILGFTLTYAITTYLNIPTIGNVRTIGTSVTWLDGSPVSTIDWGLVDNSTEYILSPWNITNIQNTPCTLTLSTANLSTSILSLTLTWNYTGAILNPNQWVVVEVTQNITATGAWTYDTVVSAVEA